MPPTAPQPTFLEVAAGDGQHGFAGTELPIPVTMQLRNAAQRPLVGVRVTWAALSSTGDVIVPEELITDENGHARARWQLDPTPGPHLLVATATGGATARASAYADARPEGDVHALALDTY